MFSYCKPLVPEPESQSSKPFLKIADRPCCQ